MFDRRLLALGATAALVLTGCSQGASAIPETFATQGDALCQGVPKELGKVMTGKDLSVDNQDGSLGGPTYTCATSSNATPTLEIFVDTLTADFTPEQDLEGQKNGMPGGRAPQDVNAPGKGWVDGTNDGEGSAKLVWACKERLVSVELYAYNKKRKPQDDLVRFAKGFVPKACEGANDPKPVPSQPADGAPAPGGSGGTSTSAPTPPAPTTTP